MPTKNMYFLQTIATSLVLTEPLWSRTNAWNASLTRPVSYPSTGASAATPVSSRHVVEVLVGAAGQLAFNPDSVDAQKGTVIRFNFLGLNHSLTQSTLGDPCHSN